MTSRRSSLGPGPRYAASSGSRPRRSPTSPSGRTIVDFGQNLVGRISLTVDGPAGTVITIRHAEILQDGELCTEILRHAEATDRYTLRGDGPETWEPRFTFHGFRYAEIDGWPGQLTTERPRGRRLPLRHGAAPGGSSAPTSGSTNCTATWSGGCGATSSTSRPTARSETSASVGPVTSQSSRRPPRSCMTRPASSNRGSPTSRQSRTTTKGVPWVVPNVLG